MDFKNVNPNMDLDNANSDMYNLTGRLVAQIVKEEDEYTMNMIEEYVKSEQARGEIIASKIIPEGRLRHIINLGLTVYNEQNHCGIVGTELFPQEQYIEFLRREMLQYQRENQKLKNQINILESMSGLRSADTELD